MKQSPAESLTHEPTSFIEYWQAVDTAMLKLFGLDTTDAGIEVELVASAQEEGQTPQEFAQWFGAKHDLACLSEAL